MDVYGILTMCWRTRRSGAGKRRATVARAGGRSHTPARRTIGGGTPCARTAHTVCANRVQIPIGVIDAAVIRALHDDVLTPDLVEDIIAGVRASREQEAAANPRAPLEAELAALEAVRARLAQSLGISEPV